MLFPSEVEQHLLDGSNNRTAELLLRETARFDRLHNINDNNTNYYDPDYRSSPDLQLNLTNYITTAIMQLNFETAIFYSELYYTECLGLPISSINRLQSVYLYSLALFMGQQYEIAAEVSERYKSTHIAIAYLFARCCLKLGKNEENACLYLVIHLDSFIKNESKDKDIFIFMPNLATIHSLIGELYRRTDNIKSSVNHYLEAIKKDPYLWQALVALNNMKAMIDLKKLFNMHSDPYTSSVSATVDPFVEKGSGPLRTDMVKQVNNGVITTNATNATAVASNSNVKHSNEDKTRGYDTRSLLYSTLSPFRSNSNKSKTNKDNIIDSSSSSSSSHDVNSNSLRKTSYSMNRQPILSMHHQQQVNPLFSANGSITPQHQQQVYTRSTRRNGDVINNNNGTLEPRTMISTNRNNHNNDDGISLGTIPSIIKNKILTTPPAKLGNETQRTTFKTPRNKTGFSSQGIATTSKRVLSGQAMGSSNTINFNVSNVGNTNNKGKYGDESDVIIECKEFKALIYTLAKVLKASSQYNSYNAIRVMNSQLPSHILNNMPWCQARLGRLHFEIVNYDMSLTYFTNLRRLQNTRLKDLEIFSTLLWHLDDKVNLSNLSSELLDAYPNSPQTWCILGNYFSLQKDHDQAIKALEKATQLDPSFAYAYTLLGHEHANNELFDVAKTFYRKALACDPQHYNAYYGLGSCASQLGKFEEALLYFEKARMINPVNVVLICCCGTELEKLFHNEMALKYYEIACKLDPRSVLAKYRRAELLFSMNRYSVALGQFEDLIRLDSENPNLHFMLGKILQALGRKKDAIKEYTIALHLDPKGNQFVIEALESCHMQE